MGFTPKHPVMSDTRCNGSEHGIVRVVYRFGSNQIQARGCAGCALPVSDQRATTMHRHFVRDSPKMKTYLNSLL